MFKVGDKVVVVNNGETHTGQGNKFHDRGKLNKNAFRSSVQFLESVLHHRLVHHLITHNKLQDIVSLP